MILPSKGVPREDPRRTHEPTCSSLCRLGSIGGSPGVPRVTPTGQKAQQNATKRHPKQYRTKTKTSKSFKITSIKRSLCQGTVAGLPQAVGYIYIYVYIFIYMCKYAYIYIFIHICIYIYIYPTTCGKPATVP